MDIDAELKQIEQRICTLTSEQFEMPACQNLHSSCKDTMETVVNQALTSSKGGKRLRALLSLLSYDAANSTISSNKSSGENSSENSKESSSESSKENFNRASMIDLACAIEVFQTAALIHDDIIDESSLRRGIPSAYCAFSKVYNNLRIGTGLGIMLGDLLAAESFNIAGNCAKNLKNTQELLLTFSDTQRSVCVGQVLDISIEMMDLDNTELLAQSSLNVFKWKTASYTTISPIKLGFLSAGLDPKLANDLAYSIGEPLGIAFQLADDLLDVVSDPKHTGKPVGGDIREGKRATLLADALQNSNEKDKAYLKKAYTKKHRSSGDVKRIIDIFYKSGAIEKSKKRIKDLWEQSQQALQNSELSEEAKNIMQSIIERFIPEQWRI